MPSQRIIWTALPNGAAGNGDLQVSVFVSPRLMSASTSPQVSEFPDFVNWPATPITWKVSVGGTSVPATVVSPAPRSSLWQALFAPTTAVQSYQYQSLAGRRFHSYPAAFVRDFHVQAYSAYASATPTEWPTVESLFRQGPGGIPPYAHLPLTPDAEQSALKTIEGMFPQSPPFAIPASGTPSPATDLEQAKVMLSALTIPPAGSTNDDVPRPDPPAIDFHQMVSMLGEYPHLLRLFGLVFDLEVAVPAGTTGFVGLTAEPTWSPALAGSVDVFPATRMDASTLLAVPRPSAPELAGGMLRMSDPGPGGQPDYPVIELELDGSTLKTLNFAQGVWRATSVAASSATPQSYALPALRSAGLAVAHTGQALEFGQDTAGSDALNAAAETTPPGPVVLHAEDVTRGFRIDVWDDASNAWHQLCARQAAPAPGGYAVGSPPTLVPVPAGDEGWVALSLAQGTAGGSNDSYLSETILRWAGWSLVAPRPGKFLGYQPTDGLQSDQNNPPTGTFPLQVAYAATPGTLPVLRYGRTYRFRARAVDLAGNGPAFDPTADAASFTWAGPPLRYGRLEPVATPPLIPHDARTPGEHVDRLVIRSEFYDTPDPSVGPSSRHVVPPSISEEIAEATGAIDTAGRPDPSTYAEIANRAGQTYATPSVVTAQGGQPDPGGFDQPYYPVGHLDVPYLPDVLSRGAAFQSLPGGPADGPLTVGFEYGGNAWPDSTPFRLVLLAGSGAPVRPTKANGYTLTVLAPKATFATVRLSSYVAADDLEMLGLWEWLEEQGLDTPALAALIESGQHWMFTPYREVTLVHAVRQPLAPPQFTKPVVSRAVGATFSLLSDTITIDRPSSVKLDILSTWTEQFDDGLNPAGAVTLDKSAPVGDIPLGLDDPTPTTVTVTDLRQDFGDTKHRSLLYQAQATTRFLEYFAETVGITLVGTSPTVVDAAGMATGATTVASTTTPQITYQPIADYVEDDSAGTIARTPKSSIPLTGGSAQVQVTYVPPPVTRSSLEKVVPPATALGYPRDIPSSGRPLSPDVRYVLPVFNFSETSSATKVTSLRRGNALRVYLGRPWYSSGDGELLGVVIYPVPVGSKGYPSALEPFVTRYGRDPLRSTDPVNPSPAASDFPLATTTGTGLLLEEAANLGSPPPGVDVAGHAVGFDTTHQLWYCDIAIDTSTAPNGTPLFSYWPFVRLGLVRYQPSSLEGVEVSRVTQADFVQLASNRLATLTFPDATRVHVTVSGFGFSEGPITGPSIVAATVEQQVAGVTDPTLQWVAVAGSTVDLPVVATPSDLYTWSGSVTLPAPRGSAPFRIRIEEAERYVSPAVGGVPQESPRVTYIDTLQI